MRVSWYSFLAVVVATLPCGEFLMGTAFSVGVAWGTVMNFQIPHWVAAAFVGAALQRTHALAPAQIVYGAIVFAMQKHNADTNAAFGYGRPWGATQAFLTFCGCLLAVFTTSLVIARVVSLMHPAKPTNSDVGGLRGA